MRPRRGAMESSRAARGIPRAALFRYGSRPGMGSEAFVDPGTGVAGRPSNLRRLIYKVFYGASSVNRIPNPGGRSGQGPLNRRGFVPS